MQSRSIHRPFSFSFSQRERECGSHRLSLLVGLEFRAVQDAAREVPEDELVVLAYAAEAVCPAITADVVECDGGDEGRVTLTSGYHSLFPRRIYIDEIVLAACLQSNGNVSTVKGNIDDGCVSLTIMKRPSGDHATQVREPK